MPAIDSVNPWGKVFIRYAYSIVWFSAIPSCYSVNSNKIKIYHSKSIRSFCSFQQPAAILFIQRSGSVVKTSYIK
jgi:hypothetical protein